MPVQSQAFVEDDHQRKCKLFVEALRAYGIASLRVIGTSMWPTLWPGDTIEIRTASVTDAHVDDLVAFTRDGRLFVHRVVAEPPMGCAALRTRGDALPHADSPVTESEFLGIARLIDPVPRSLFRRLRQTIRYRVLAPARLIASVKP